MPRSYVDTEEFCKLHNEPFPCADARKKAEKGRWVIRNRCRIRKWLAPVKHGYKLTESGAFPPSKKPSASHPIHTRTLVSDFVAKKTGELFLFVNDAMPLIFMRTDKHYSNNRGYAKIILSRVQLSKFRTHSQSQRSLSCRRFRAEGARAVICRNEARASRG